MAFVSKNHSIPLASKRQLLALDKLIEKAVRSTDNAIFTKLSLELLRAGGKRLRPSMIIGIANSSINSQVKIDDTLVVACAVELLHLSSLVHDDLMDEASFRRGITTINKQFGSSHAVLLGDYLLARAFEQAAKVGDIYAEELSMVFADMCDGQMNEIIQRFDQSRTTEDYFDCVGKKTAGLFAMSYKFGARLAGFDEKTQKEYYRVGYNFGMSYQLKDDLADIDEDISQGNYTLPVILYLRSRPTRNDLTQLSSKDIDGSVIKQVKQQITRYS